MAVNAGSRVEATPCIRVQGWRWNIRGQMMDPSPTQMSRYKALIRYRRKVDTSVIARFSLLKRIVWSDLAMGLGPATRAFGAHRTSARGGVFCYTRAT